MGKHFAYARVSTPRQGEGVSLPEQKAAIERYAAVHGLEITRWFEERETASKTGRPVFDEMLRLLRLRKIDGVIIHKIDRSMRNSHDWAYVGDLVDAGVQVHFATENVDMETVAGRLSADIQAAVAMHYSRNLREEVKKGIYGRLKQGFYPFRAPIGYLDQGAAKNKIADPVRAPLVAKTFRLYASGRFSLPDLVREMFRQGLRNRNGGPVTVNGLATILKNPFYISLIRIRKTGQTFAGNHESLITTDVFEKAQAVLAGKRPDRSGNHLFTYSRIAHCKTCGYSLIAEIRKGHVYYRCHNRPFKNPPACPLTAVREERLDEAVLNTLAAVDLSEDELNIARAKLDTLRKNSEEDRATRIGGLRLHLDHIQSRLEKLADALIDGTIEKDLFTRKQNVLLLEEARVKEQLAEVEKGSLAAVTTMEQTVGLAKSPSALYKMASPEKKRELLKTLLLDLAVCGKNVEMTLTIPFRTIAERQKMSDGGAYRGTCRTWEEILNKLQKYFEDPSKMIA
jgi:site-specific DNA recombinase